MANGTSKNKSKGTNGKSDEGDPVTNERKAPVTHKDLTIAYMLGGLDDAEELLVGHTNAVDVLNKSIETLKAKGQASRELEGLRDQFAESKTPGTRGRRPAKVGDRREFSVQQIKDAEGNAGDVFIRLPLSALGVKKGDKVAARFMEGEIVLTSTEDVSDEDTE